MLAQERLWGSHKPPESTTGKMGTWRDWGDRSARGQCSVPPVPMVTHLSGCPSSLGQISQAREASSLRAKGMCGNWDLGFSGKGGGRSRGRQQNRGSQDKAWGPGQAPPPGFRRKSACVFHLRDRRARKWATGFKEPNMHIQPGPSGRTHGGTLCVLRGTQSL